jgi:hypothetical protein
MFSLYAIRRGYTVFSIIRFLDKEKLGKEVLAQK